MAIVFKIVLLLFWVNLLPPLGLLILKERFNRPLDGDLLWFDKRPVFGHHKTIRGILLAILGGTAFAPLLGVSWQAAAIASLLAMAGDLLSSFIKRRLSFPSGQNIFLLDQLFEALLPLLFLSRSLHLSFWQAVLILAGFIPVAYLGSCFWSFLTFRPPVQNYTRIVRSTVRLREWRSCHLPLARWQVLLNPASFLSYQVIYTWIFKLSGLEDQGKRNSLDIRLEEVTFRFPDLPEAFDGFRILLLTDLHLDGLEGLTEGIIERIRHLKVDLCLIGGDIRMKTYGPMAPCLRHLRLLTASVRSAHGILGVLGNHDCIEMVPDFEEAGVVMLINDAWKLTRNGASIWVVGIDDPHYYRVDDVSQAFRDVPDQGFTIFLAHSPEAYTKAAEYRPQLYLCGHTHGGQIRLPARGPLFTNSRAPRFTAEGVWRYGGMTGYTSRGAGASGVPLRFNCPGEISLITLRREDRRTDPATDTGRLFHR